MSSQIWYPQSALEGFGQAVGQSLGVRVKFDSGMPSTDGSTVTLPPIRGLLDRDGFDAYCGVVIHECAHVRFDTPRWMDVYVRAGAAPETHELRQLCFNAAVDIADETRIEKIVPTAKYYLIAMNKRWATENVLADGFASGDPVRNVLAISVALIRWPTKELVACHKKHQHRGLIAQAHKILKSATDRAKKVNPHRPWRTSVQWGRLDYVADKLVDLLTPLRQANPAPQQPQQQPGQTGAGAGMGMAASSASGSDGEPSNDIVVVVAAESGQPTASGSDGEKLASDYEHGRGSPTQGQQRQRPASQPPQQQQPGSGAGGDSYRGSLVPSRRDAYDAVRPCISGVLERLTAAENSGEEDGYASGPRIGRSVERALIDGRCFVRRNGEREALHLAVLLDNSGSMCGILPVISAVAQAFVDAAKSVADTIDLWTFETVPEKVESFAKVCDGGGTGTHLVLKEVEECFAQYVGGRKLVVCLTDGEPDNELGTRQRCEQLRSKGISVIGIDIGSDKPHMIPNSMPGALAIYARTPNELACRLSQVAASMLA